MWVSNTPLLTIRSAQRLAVLSAVLLFAFAAIAHAQTPQARPVARLVTTIYPDSTPRRTTERTPTPPKNAIPLAEATAIERRAFDETNAIRVKNGLPPFEWDGALCLMARLHSENMARLNFFAHVTPEGLRLKDRARAVGIEHYEVLAENIAYNSGYDDPGAFAVERWMLSPGHRANILYAGFRAMAIGTFVAADGSVYLTQDFIAR